jgi:hypothetical protein
MWHPRMSNDGRLSAGHMLLHYRIIEVIGEGGMGVVYKAHDEKLKRLVALKVLHEDPAHAGEHARLQHEARAASALNHPSICTIHDFDEHESHCFIVMEYLVGETLRERAASPISEEQAVSIALAVAGALATAHQHRIIHCDIKPANIFLTTGGDVKVLDFGIAKLPSSSIDTGVLTPPDGAGTRAYMSPEQVRGDAVDVRTDVFALGAVLREMVPHPGARLARVIATMTHEERDGRPSMGEVSTMLGALRGRDRRPRWPMVAAGLVAVSIAVGGWAWLALRPPGLVERDWILIGEFANLSANPVFSEVLDEVVAVQLGQSPYLVVFPESRIAEQLALMRRPPNQRLTAEIARDLCERVGIKAFVTGSVMSVGARFVVRLDVLNARTGDYLAREQVEVEDAGAVLSAIGKASSAIRRTLGESYQSIQRFDVPVETATTASLEALRAFRLGQDQLRLGTAEAMKAVPYFKRAIELDPEFSLAYARLGVAYANAREAKRSEEAARQAFLRRSRVSERERYEIETRYYDNVSGEVSKAVEVVEIWARTYPADPRPYNTLSTYFKNLGQLERAAEMGEQARRLAPTSAIYRSNLAGAYFRLGQFDRASVVCEDAIRDGLDNSTTHRFLYAIAVITGDTAMAAREEAWRSQRTSDYALVEYQASAAGAAGRLTAARELYRRAVLLAEQQELLDRAAEYRVRWAQLELLLGYEREAMDVSAPVIAGDASRLLQADAALVLAAAGNRQFATVTDRLAHEFPDDENLRRIWRPMIEAIVNLRAGRAAAAAEQLRSLGAFDRGDHAGLRPSYYEGLAHLANDAGIDARRSFQKVIDNRGVVANSALYPLAHLGLARAAAREGQVVVARQAYERFFALWPEADPDLPVLKAAKREYALTGPR